MLSETFTADALYEGAVPLSCCHPCDFRGGMAIAWSNRCEPAGNTNLGRLMILSKRHFGAWLQAIFASAVVLPLFCGAAPVNSFAFVLTVEQIAPCHSESTSPAFGCSTAVGDKWNGSFQIAVDPATVPNGGLSTPFISMRLVTGDLVWDHCALNGTCARESNNLLWGYRDWVGLPYHNQNTPGFNVKNGKISGIAGGFFGGGDSSFIDFDYFFASGPGGGKFSARDETGQYVTGSYEVHSVPTPNTISLVCIALFSFWVVRLRRPIEKRDSSTSPVGVPLKL